MPEEIAATAPVAGPAPTVSRSRPFVVGALGCGCVVLAGVLILVVQLAMGASDFPRVAPEDMADRAFRRSQDAYDVMGFTRTVRPGVEDHGVSTENTLSSAFCYGGGLFSLDETVDGAYRMNHSWALDHVPAGQAAPGFRRLHQHLEGNGWEVTSYREGGAVGDWDLFVQRDDGDERMSFTWDPEREYFSGGASGPCAYDPAWEDGDVGLRGDSLWPPVLAPA